MVDLFRYIEHDFAVPAAADAIDVANESEFQEALGDALAGEDDQSPVAERIRALATDFLSRTFESPTADPTTLGEPLAALPGELRALPAVNATTVRRAVRDLFGKTPKQVVAGADFKRDLELLQNATVATKLVTAFDQLDAARVVRQVRAAAFVSLLAADDQLALDRADVRRLLARPLRIPSGPLAATGVVRGGPASPEVPPGEGEEEARLRTMSRERDVLQAAHDALQSLGPDAVQLVVPDPAEPPRERARDEGREPDQTHVTDVPAFGRSVVRLTETGLAQLPADQQRALTDLGIDLGSTPVPVLLERAARRLADLNVELLPATTATRASVFRVGGRLMAEVPTTTTLMDEVPPPAPDFSKAVTRPVGVGNLQVVRQELIGYRPGEISHIENVLEGEMLRRRTRRHEFVETFETFETTSTESRERDHQSTDRNELVTEAQRESGHQTSRAGDGMTSSDYGKLVENSKTNFAQTVVSKSVETITQSVHQTRGRREGRSFREQVRHDLDNHEGTEKVRGIYQWVDKEYSLRVLNYGKRLMYDVVVPEPAAVLVQALQSAVQPETFQLVKPINSIPAPDGINASNYRWYARQYGVSGSVSPPPAVYDQRAVSFVQPVVGSESTKAYGIDVTPAKTGALKIQVPEGYQALSGYVQMTNAAFLGDVPPGAILEIYVGESHRHRLLSPEHPYVNVSFQMAGETGEVPVTWRTFERAFLFSFAVAVVCRRTDAALAEWQLKTHATLVSGYQRQLAEYEDKLTRYVAAVRAQLAAGGLAHDPSVTREELKRAFIFLLIGEHPPAWLPTPAPAPAPPGATLPDPLAVREWGAMVAFFERAFEWENLMFTCYPYYWARPQRWQELVIMQDADPQFEAFLKAGAARVVVPVRPGFEAALAHFQETGDVWMGEEMPDMFGDHYLSIIDEIRAANYAPGKEVCVEQWKVTLPTTLVLLKDDATLPSWTPTPCGPGAEPPPEP